MQKHDRLQLNCAVFGGLLQVYLCKDNSCLLKTQADDTPAGCMFIYFV